MDDRQLSSLEGLIDGVWYVYVDRRADDKQVFYVGKGNRWRILYGRRNALWHNIANKHGYERQVFLATKDEKFALEHEVRLIFELKTHHDDGRGGCNLTHGGEGTSGYRHTDATKETMSGPSHPFFGVIGGKHPNHGRKRHDNGRPRSPSTRAKLAKRASSAGRLHPNEIANIRDEYARGELSQKKLATKYGVSQSTISNIVNGRTWSSQQQRHRYSIARF